MHLYIFNDNSENNKIDIRYLKNRLGKIAQSTESTNLVVALYLKSANNLSFGSAYIKCFTPDKFTTARGKWKFTKNWPMPEDLPDKYSFIRICIGYQGRFPRTETDRYGWKLSFNSVYDKAAFIFAHELHHYRRYHLSLHEGEGEQSANKWALKHLIKSGFLISGRKLPLNKRVKKKRIQTLFDPLKKFRYLKAGDSVKIVIDPKKRYTGEKVLVVKSIRSNSKRIVVETSDGRQWRWPMAWLSVPESIKK